MRKVLLAIDGSKNSEAALAWYLQHMKFPNDELTLVTIFTPPSELVISDADIWADSSSIAKLDDEASKRVQSFIDKSVAKCKENDITPKVLIQKDASPKYTLTKLANSGSYDALVLGQRGLNAVERVFLGSTSDYCVHHAKIPVIVVPN